MDMVAKIYIFDQCGLQGSAQDKNLRFSCHAGTWQTYAEFELTSRIVVEAFLTLDAK
jgi:hypothetical protein